MLPTHSHTLERTRKERCVAHLHLSRIASPTDANASRTALPNRRPSQRSTEVHGIDSLPRREAARAIPPLSTPLARESAVIDEAQAVMPGSARERGYLTHAVLAHFHAGNYKCLLTAGRR